MQGSTIINMCEGMEEGMEQNFIIKYQHIFRREANFILSK